MISITVCASCGEFGSYSADGGELKKRMAAQPAASMHVMVCHQPAGKNQTEPFLATP